MKKGIFLLVFLTLLSCKKENQESNQEPVSAIQSEGMPETKSESQKPEDLGAEIFNGKGACVACHKPDEKLVGPSLQEIAKIYKDKNANMIAFFKGAAEPVVDAAQFSIMKPNLEITKTFSDEELKALETYVYSNLK